MRSLISPDYHLINFCNFAGWDCLRKDEYLWPYCFSQYFSFLFFSPHLMRSTKHRIKMTIPNHYYVLTRETLLWSGKLPSNYRLDYRWSRITAFLKMYGFAQSALNCWNYLPTQPCRFQTGFTIPSTFSPPFTLLSKSSPSFTGIWSCNLIFY